MTTGAGINNTGNASLASCTVSDSQWCVLVRGGGNIRLDKSRLLTSSWSGLGVYDAGSHVAASLCHLLDHSNGAAVYVHGDGALTLHGCTGGFGYSNKAGT